MAAPPGPAAQAPIGLIGGWGWLAAHAVPLLIAIYFAGFLCTALLSLYAARIARHVRHLARAIERQSVLIDSLMKSAADQESSGSAAPACPTAAADPAPSGGPPERPELDSARVRTELESVLNELWSEDTQATAQDRSPET
jgi:hypothetical protein